MNQPWVASVPPNYPPYNPLPSNYYPVTQPQPAGLGTMGAVGLGAAAGLGFGALAAHPMTADPRYRTNAFRNNKNKTFQPNFELLHLALLERLLDLTILFAPCLIVQNCKLDYLMETLANCPTYTI